MNRLGLTALRRALTHRRAVAASVHFHRGPQGAPAACFDEGCDSPRLEVR